MFTRMRGILICCAFLAVLYGGPAAAASQDAQRQQEEQAAEAKLQELDKGMKDLEEESGRRSGQPRTEINRLYKEFKKQQGAAHKDLEALRKATNETWEKARAEMNQAIENLQGLYERTKAKMREEKEGEK